MVQRCQFTIWTRTPPWRYQVLLGPAGSLPQPVRGLHHGCLVTGTRILPDLRTAAHGCLPPRDYGTACITFAVPRYNGWDSAGYATVAAGWMPLLVNRSRLDVTSTSSCTTSCVPVVSCPVRAGSCVMAAYHGTTTPRMLIHCRTGFFHGCPFPTRKQVRLRPVRIQLN